MTFYIPVDIINVFLDEGNPPDNSDPNSTHALQKDGKVCNVDKWIFLLKVGK